MGSIGWRAWPSIPPSQLSFVCGPLVIAGAAWVWTVQRMTAMHVMRWSYPTDLGLYIGTWVAMMAAMMIPATSPRS